MRQPGKTSGAWMVCVCLWALGGSVSAQVADSSLTVEPLGPGDSMPGVTVQTLDGDRVGLAKTLSGQKTALIVYRGGWCPYCTKHLAAVGQAREALAEAGYRIVALAPDVADSVRQGLEGSASDFTLLLDPDMAAIQKLGLAFRLDADTVAKYDGYGIKLLDLPSSTDKVLPVPAVFLVDEGGRITFAHAEPDYRKRLEASELVAAAQGRLATRNILYRDGDSVLQGYLAHDPSLSGKRPGVVVVHEWWGLNSYARRRARQLAALGYVAFAADIYGKGILASDYATAGKLAGKYKGDRRLMRRRVQLAVDALRSQPNVDRDRIGAVGYCFGGTCVLELARSGADVAAVVSFHGGLDADPALADTGPIRASVLACHGADDPHVPPAQVAAFRQEMTAREADWQLKAYPEAVHAFTNPDSGSDPAKGVAYNEPADKASWKDMQDFFAEKFK